MGLYNLVELEEKVPCPDCGADLKGWQTKDGEVYMDEVTISDIDNFYTICDNCKLWVEFRRKRPQKSELWEHFELLKSRIKLSENKPEKTP